MAKKKQVLEFNFNKVYHIIESLEANKEEAVEKAIEVSSKFVQKDLDVFFDKGKGHHMTGKADEALIENPKIEHNRGRIEMFLGFDKTKPHGYLAYLFEKGTPKSNPKSYKFISKAFKNKKAISAMNYVLGEYWRNGGEKFK